MQFLIIVARHSNPIDDIHLAFLLIGCALICWKFIRPRVLLGTPSEYRATNLLTLSSFFLFAMKDKLMSHAESLMKYESYEKRAEEGFINRLSRTAQEPGETISFLCATEGDVQRLV